VLSTLKNNQTTQSKQCLSWLLTLVLLIISIEIALSFLIEVNNSKGNTLELAQESALLSAQLEQGFANSGDVKRVENWSVTGIRTSQIDILLTHAVSLGVPQVVVMASISNIDPEREYEFDNHPADIDLLVGNPATWKLLSKTHSLSNISFNQKMIRFLKLYSNLFKARTHFETWLADRLPAKYHKTLFGRFLHQDTPLVILDQKLADPAVKRPKNTDTVVGERFLTAFKLNRGSTLDHLIESISTLQKESETEIIFIFDPVTPQDDTSISHGLSPFADLSCSKVTDFTCLNWTSLLPREVFYNRSFGSHYDIRGQKQVAKELLGVLQK